MVKRRPGVSILPLMLIVILCVSWLTQLNQRDEMTYDEMVQLFEQQKSSNLTAIPLRRGLTGWGSCSPI